MFLFEEPAHLTRWAQQPTVLNGVKCITPVKVGFFPTPSETHLFEKPIYLDLELGAFLLGNATLG